MAIKKENSILVDMAFIDRNFDGQMVLVAYHGEVLEAGMGYIEYSSSYCSDAEYEEDSNRLHDILENQFNNNGRITSGCAGGGNSFIL